MKLLYKLGYPIRVIYTSVYFPIYKKKLAAIVAQLCNDNDYILDFGCDDGSVSEEIMRINPTLKIVGIDVQSIRGCRIPRKIYDGRRIPYPDNNFDVVFSLDVLHHTHNIESLVKEMARVSKDRVVIKDHMVYGRLTFFLVGFADYMTNAPFGIRCAYNYLTAMQWKGIFKSANLMVRAQPKHLDFGLGNTEYFNPVFVLKKIS